MKTLLEASNIKRHGLYVNNIEIKHNKAYARYMDMEISENISHVDGFFIPDLLNTPHEKTVNLPENQAYEPVKIGEWKKNSLIEREEFLKNLEYVSIAMSTDEVRYYLNGVAFDQNRIVATDGHRLHMADLSVNFTDKDDIKIIPNYAIKYMILLMKEYKSSKYIGLEFHETGFIFRIDECQIDCKFIDGTFPQYRRIIPQNNNMETIWDASEFKETYKTCKMLSKAEKERFVIIELSETGITHMRTKTLFSSDTTTENKICLNAEYLKNVPSGVLKYSDTMTTIVVESGNKKSIIMPVRG